MILNYVKCIKMKRHTYKNNSIIIWGHRERGDIDQRVKNSC